MADDGEVSALVCDNGSGMVKVRVQGNWFDVHREGGLGLFFLFLFLWVLARSPGHCQSP